MTLRERMLITLKHGKADMVSCCPDISIMVPIRLKKKPFWSLYVDEEKGTFQGLYDNENLLNAYIDAVRYFGTIAWAWYLQPIFGPKKIIKNGKTTIYESGYTTFKNEIIDRSLDRVVVRTTMQTPDGELESETIYPFDNPPTPVKKFIKDFKRDFKFIKYFYPPLDDIDFSPVFKEKALVGDLGVNLVGVHPPSLVFLDIFVDGGLGKLGLIYYDYPGLIEEFKKMHEKWSMEYLQKIIDANCCDEIMTGGSGLMTWQSPEITRKLSLDGLKQITRICRERGMISHLHCCGFEYELVKMCAEETDLDVIEPLEPPPQGDCDLKVIKEKFGKKLVLKGNLQTSIVMLSDVKTVEMAAVKCIDDAAKEGSFILSTGDQCGRDTPDENIFKLVEVCEKYGKY